MDINSFRGTDTDLGRFLNFCDNIDNDTIIIKEEDWDNMCGIFVRHDIGNGYGVLANFYIDGHLRCIKEITEEEKEKQYEDLIGRRIKYMSTLGFIKRKFMAVYAIWQSG